jgi:hypothetical protein
MGDLAKSFSIINTMGELPFSGGGVTFCSDNDSSSCSESQEDIIEIRLAVQEEASVGRSIRTTDLQKLAPIYSMSSI